jgi:hypothetical protein
MIHQHTYQIAQQRIADLLGETDRERRAAAGRSRTTRTDRPGRLIPISRRRTRGSIT